MLYFCLFFIILSNISLVTGAIRSAQFFREIATTNLKRRFFCMQHKNRISTALCDIKAAGTLHPDKNVAWKTLNDRLMRQKSKKPSFMPHDRLKLQFSCDNKSENRALRKEFGRHCRMNGVKSDFYATWKFICLVQGRRHINRVKKPPEYYNPGAFILCSFMYKKH